ncbi:MAG TPA: serpin family protein [Longimicrobiales bacterium]|nr:serpin family protein [Longimicrobiales bacterium]
MGRSRSGIAAGGMLRAAAALVMSLMLCTGCELLADPGEDMRPDLEPLERLPREMSAAELAVIEASNGFAFDLLRETAAREDSANIMLSPLSASMALGMTMNGARGATFAGMRDALGFAGLDQEQINASYSAFIDMLLHLDAGVDMRIANSVWARSGFAFHDSFLETVRHAFGAEVSTIDFSAPAAVPTINQWVDRSTNGRITEILEAIPGDMVMYLINAIYFKGDWQDRFDRSLTRDAQFTRADGSTTTVSMMSREGGFEYNADADVQIAELRYGRGAFVMDIVLPREGRTVDELIATLDEVQWNQWIAGLDSTGMHLRMPKYRLEYDTKLNAPLIALGMGSAFGLTNDTDFTGLSPHGRDLEISVVRQKTFISVDEEGTEAAAVTSVGIRVTSMPATMVVDRPFLVVIRERFAGAILFIGKVGDPALAQ